MNTLSLVFAAVVVAGLALQWWLVYRQSRHIAEHRDAVPEDFSDRIALDEHQRAASYNLARLGIERWDLLLGSMVLLAWTLGGGLSTLDRATSAVEWHPLWIGVLFIVSLFVINALIDLPLAIWRTFVVEARFGFNRTTPAAFVRDRLLGGLLMLLLGAPLVAAMLWLMTRAGEYWWLFAWMVWMTFTLGVTFIYPTWIAPIFNRFEPLQDTALRSRLENLLGRCGFRSDGMFVMDGSRRSTHGNAYFTGFGRHKRIVFYDTLLHGLDSDEVEAVLAHELGHFKRGHIRKRLLLSAMTALLGLYVLGWLSGQGWFYVALGAQTQSPAMALALFLLVVPAFTVFLSPLMSYLSRRHEFEADDFAAEQTDPRHLISGLVKMYRDNASTLTPDPLYSAFHHSHPPATHRVDHLSRKIPAAS